MPEKKSAMLAIAAGLAVASGIGHAQPSASTAPDQPWPAKPIRMLVGFPPGGPTDVVARLVSEKLGAQINQRIVVDNRPGAAGNIAVEMLAKANRDGYTLLYSSNAIALSPGLYSKLGYDPYKDIAPVTEIGNGCLIFVVHPSLPVQSVQAFIDYAKARPAQLNYGSSGAGTSTHLAAVLFSQRTGIQTQHVPYKGTAPSLLDTVAGRVQFLMGAVLTAVPHVKEGRLRALAVTGHKRIASLPELRTLDEAALPGFVVTTWQGVFAPGGTPQPVLAKVHAALVQAIRSPELKPRIEQQDMDPSGPSLKEFTAAYYAELKRWTKVAKDAGLKAD
ncbi:MAG TPA: tripartite tricarboxylate transporter substrate binding protein [Burkholderiales bacterium]|nr:tripartite tricarboxylate transporter substrate binding protein [Burkholderiales bacterium]